MEKHCTMVYFSLRESKQNKKGLSPIEVSITTNGKRIYFSTGKHVPAADWNKEKQVVKGKSEEAQLINGYLIQLRNKIYQKEIELLQKGYLITAELLKEAITDKVEALNEKTLLDVLNEHNTERKAMVGKTVAPATYWVFEYTGRLFKEFIQKKYERKDLYLREINLGFIQGFIIRKTKRCGFPKRKVSKIRKFQKRNVFYLFKHTKGRENQNNPFPCLLFYTFNSNRTSSLPPIRLIVLSMLFS